MTAVYKKGFLGANTSQSLGRMSTVPNKSKSPLMCLTFLGSLSSKNVKELVRIGQPRPAATILLPHKGRFLSGRNFSATHFLLSSSCAGVEAMVMMGMPVDTLEVSAYSDRDSWPQPWVLKPWITYLTTMGLWNRYSATQAKDLRKLAGNSMHLRALLAAITIILKAMNPTLLKAYLSWACKEPLQNHLVMVYHRKIASCQ